ncbi:hypothetical protein TL16_g05541 [Triparma laevis f. inornata]|uniref:Uncharacterized protein n=1 Tax=Triparma laevis f. inornata TaxID=1714386 RepID=A0A9W7AFL3_9STRA|nr:hypothetical protein TL16_g05541 [Triparma laevis f. inornata]
MCSINTRRGIGKKSLFIEKAKRLINVVRPNRTVSFVSRRVPANVPVVIREWLRLQGEIETRYSNHNKLEKEPSSV